LAFGWLVRFIRRARSMSQAYGIVGGRGKGPSTLRTGSVPPAASSKDRCLLDVRALSGSKPPPGRVPPRLTRPRLYLVRDTASARTSGAARPVRPVLDWSSGYPDSPTRCLNPEAVSWLSCGAPEGEWPENRWTGYRTCDRHAS